MSETNRMDTLSRLERTIASRRDASPDESYVAKLNAKGLPKMAQKLGEEATEAVIAAVSGSNEELVGEAWSKRDPQAASAWLRDNGFETEGRP